MSWKKKLPMAATMSRIFVAPIIFALLLVEAPWGGWVAAALFLIGAFTDWLDGYWARAYDAETNMGRLMDPIADKILVLAALIVLVYNRRIDPVAPALILARDIFIGGLRSVAAADNVIIAAKPAGKFKTAFQLVTVPCLFVEIGEWSSLLHKIGIWGIWISVLLSLVSATEYTMGYFRGTKKQNYPGR